jgi:hypothetical protein
MALTDVNFNLVISGQAEYLGRARIILKGDDGGELQARVVQGHFHDLGSTILKCFQLHVYVYSSKIFLLVVRAPI